MAFALAYLPNPFLEINAPRTRKRRNATTRTRKATRRNTRKSKR